MGRSPRQRLMHAERPWTVTWRASSSEAFELAMRLQAEGAVARVLRGWKMTSWPDFYAEVGAALQFPPHFGENLNALHDCLTDMIWLRGPAYVLVVADAHRLLRDAGPDGLEAFLDHVAWAGEFWAEPNDPGTRWGHGEVAFHAVLQVPADEWDEWTARLAGTGRKAPAVDLGWPRPEAQASEASSGPNS